MAAVRVIDDLLATPLLQQIAAAVLSLATLDDVQRHNRGDDADEGVPMRQTNALLAEDARRRRA